MGKLIVWFINKSKWFMVIALILFLLSTFLLIQNKGDGLLFSLFYAAEILMGSSYRELQDDNFVFGKYTALVLVLLRLFGWLIIPIVIGMIIDEKKEDLEMKMETSKRILLETEKRLSEYREVIDNFGIQSFIAAGDTPEEAKQRLLLLRNKLESD